MANRALWWPRADLLSAQAHPEGPRGWRSDRLGTARCSAEATGDCFDRPGGLTGTAGTRQIDRSRAPALLRTDRTSVSSQLVDPQCFHVAVMAGGSRHVRPALLSQTWPVSNQILSRSFKCNKRSIAIRFLTSPRLFARGCRGAVVEDESHWTISRAPFPSFQRDKP